MDLRWRTEGPYLPGTSPSVRCYNDCYFVGGALRSR
jgi:hypothetical protein